MARPSKSAKVQVGHITEEERQERLQQEQLLKGNGDKIQPSNYLSKDQKKLFNLIVGELEASGILGNLDIFVLETTIIAIDRLQAIEKMINENINNLFDKTLMATKDKYTKDLWRGCSELSLSPQSRAKLGNINVQAKNNANDELLKALRGE